MGYLGAESKQTKPTSKFFTMGLRILYLEPAATRVPLGLKVTWFALVVKRVRIPSGSPSGKVWT